MIQSSAEVTVRANLLVLLPRFFSKSRNTAFVTILMRLPTVLLSLWLPPPELGSAPEEKPEPRTLLSC